MKKIINCLFLAPICLFFILTACPDANGEENRIRAKIGIQITSTEKSRFAKARDRLKSGDLIRLYVHPEKASYIYVVYSDKNDISLLSMVNLKIKSASLVLPSTNEFYEIDGASAAEVFTIICSPVEMGEISEFFESSPSYVKWQSLEKELQAKSKIEMNEKTDTPFAIAGNVRGGIVQDQDSVVKKLRIFTGNDMVVKKYEFKVKK